MKKILEYGSTMCGCRTSVTLFIHTYPRLGQSTFLCTYGELG